jgi:YD repeat-containing protein
MAMQVGLFGPNWRSTYEEQVFRGSDGNMKYSRGDGNFWSFAQGASPANVISPGDVVATLASGSTYWTITFQDGEQRLFNNITGFLTTIIDRNGNQTQISYDGSNRLSTVTDPASRKLTFNYPNGSSRLVSSVTSTDVGITVGYSYDTQNRLWVVTMPDNSTLTFTYESHSLIGSITDSQGKILESHTYDGNGRGLTASQANGVNAVTITYP